MKNNHLQCAFHQGHRALVQLVTVALPHHVRAEFLNHDTKEWEKGSGEGSGLWCVGKGPCVGAAPGDLG